MSSPASATTAVVGGLPTVSVDVPICAVFLALYLTSAALNLKTFIQNRRRRHKFLITWVLFVLSMIRIITCSMRIAWATSPTNSHIAIAAQVFNNAGIIILYIVNMVLAQRVLRAKQPQVGWHPVFRVAFKIVCGLVVASLIMAIVALVVSINTTSLQTLQAIRDVNLASATYSAFISVLPLGILVAAYATRLPQSLQEDFGTGSLTGKTVLVLLGSCLCITIAGFKAGTAWETPRPATNPAWYHSKAAFYCFGFMLEIMTLILYIFSRIDNRFYVPDGCKGPGDCSRLREQQANKAEEETRIKEIPQSE